MGHLSFVCLYVNSTRRLCFVFVCTTMQCAVFVLCVFVRQCNAPSLCVFVFTLMLFAVFVLCLYVSSMRRLCFVCLYVCAMHFSVV